MNVPDTIRGAGGHATPASDPNPEDAIRTGAARDGVTTTTPPRSAEPEARKISAKWIIAAVVLAALVFGITIVLQLMGPSNKGTEVQIGGPASPDRLNLTFATTKLPAAPEGVDVTQPTLDAEYKVPGWADFWFENANDKPVSVGLYGTSCSCTGAKMFLLPPGSKMQPGKEATLEDRASGSTLNVSREPSATVQPGQAGWVRVQWSGEARKPSFTVTLWMNSHEGGPFPKLEVFLKFHDVFTVQPVDPLGQIAAAELTKPREVVITCWSSTRRAMKLSAETLGGREGVAEPLVVGKPRRIDDKEYPGLAKRFATRENPSPKVMSVYELPVYVRGRTDDGKPIDAGPFRRRLEVSLDGFAHAYSLDLQGQILGDIEVFGLTSNRVDFSSFVAKKGSRDRTLVLQSDGGAKKLEVDKARTAEFLDVELKANEKTGAAPSWQMTLRVKPDAVTGRFPRENPEELRDSAVYIRPVGVKDARATRIPVEGSATSD